MEEACAESWSTWISPGEAALAEGIKICSSGSSERGTVSDMSPTSIDSKTKSSTKSPVIAPASKRPSQQIARKRGVEVERPIVK